MKKITSALFTFFSVSFAIAQSTCATAVPVALNSTTTAPAFTSENGTAPTLLCGLQGGTAVKGKWYKFTATQNINITVSTLLAQNNNSDTRLVVYSGDCSSLVCIDSNDDYNGALSSQITFAATTNTTYTFAFDNKYSSLAFDFTVMEAAPVGPDRLSFTSQAITGVTGGYNNCIVDMNGDYLDDIVSAVDVTHLAITYQQPGGTFSTTTYTVPNTTVLPSWSIAAGDYDNNGYNDLVYGSGSGVCFLKANSNGSAYTSDRKTQSYLVQRTNFIDINNDGKLDAFACDDNAPNRYYMNDGTNLNHNQGGIGDFPSGGNYASNWFDYDNDGDVDMYLAKCGQGGSGVGGNIDMLLKNNGNGTYTNVAAEANMANPEQTWSGACGDFNNDGWMDVIVGVNSASNGFTNVKKNNGDGTFTSVTAGSGYDTNTFMGREYVAQDFDNDGFLDVLGSGNNIMFGDGNFHFTPNPNMYNISSVDRPIGDLNNDGFLDIQNGSNVLFNNGNTNKWLNVDLQGIQSNRNGIGARVEIHGSWGQQIRYVQSGTGFENMSTITAHFGLGQATTIDQVVIKWPSGIIDTINNVTTNSRLLVVEGSTLAINSYNNGVFSIYPNPAKNVVNIQLQQNSNVMLNSAIVYDLTGKVVLTLNDVSQPINVEKLTTGTYILSISDSEGRSYSQKFIKK
ncbi:FG-GAP-like repeat-containing protein [Flavobacterium paronense]|uniref:FG-GAP-like repeat-containing protein n=1 Tax=Flavobacterium paronense TaxID=1392775 RepID=A0ABV5GBW4_9FLAO|nr:FG-GAP-like repeat-containing protein [Flavobacterium paronense]MDN3677765.1 FG-GAP-like repeat-containing protein [Flavobacterium paronense]